MSLNPVTKLASDVVTYVKRQFGDESNVQITDADIYRWINSAQLQVVAKIAPIKAKGTTNVVEGQKIYDLSALAIHQIDSIHYNGNYLPQKNFSEAERVIFEFPENPDSVADPAFWYEYAGQVYLYPVPNQTIVGGLEIFYVKMPSPVSSGADALTIPDKYFDAIASWVLSKAYELDEEFDQAANYRQHFDNQLSEQNGEDRVSANMTYPVITYLGD